MKLLDLVVTLMIDSAGYKKGLKEAKEGIKVLDVGCGYGFIGIVISQITNSYVDMVDVNLRAMHLAEINSKEKN